MSDIQALRAELERRYQITDFVEKRSDYAIAMAETMVVPDALAYLRDHEGYRHLCFLTCIDRLEENELELVYSLRNHDTKHDLVLKTRLDREDPEMQTCHTHWAAVATYERELRENFGIRFPGCPRVDEDFVLEGWEGPPPMRRDFDTRKYSEETYFPRPGRTTNDPAEHMKKTQYPGRADL